MSTDELDRFFSQDAPAPERVNGRYQWADPVTGSERSWQTASNYAYPVVDHWALDRWRTRQLLIGLGRRPDLLAVLAAMVEPDNGKLDEVTATALEVAGTTEKANRGTAVHSALEAADLGKAWPDMFNPHVSAYRAALDAAGLRAVAVEQQVLNRDLGAAGKFDRIYEEADGTFVTGDVKTSGRLDLGALEHAVQFAVYNGASHVRTPDGQWVLMPALRRDYAVLVHVDAETGATSIYRVSLRIGQLGANLAAEVRGLRKMGPILLPYVSPEPADMVTVADRTNEGSVDGSRRVFEGREQIFQLGEWMDVYPPAPRGMEQAVPVGGPDPFASAANGAAGADQPVATTSNLRSADDLLRQKVSKAEVQQYARTVDPEGVGKDLAHTKKILVEMLGKRGKLAPAGSVAQSGPAPVMPAAASDTEAFRALTLARIREASTVGDLQLLNRAVVKERGDQAWTDEFTEAARLKVAELDAAAGPVLDESVVTKIRAAVDTKELGRIWEAVTIGGSDQKRWEPYEALGQARMAELNNARPPAPANPFADN